MGLERALPAQPRPCFLTQLLRHLFLLVWGLMLKESLPRTGEMFFCCSSAGSSNTPPSWGEAWVGKGPSSSLGMEQMPRARAEILQENTEGDQWFYRMQMDPFPPSPAPQCKECCIQLLLCLGRGDCDVML